MSNQNFEAGVNGVRPQMGPPLDVAHSRRSYVGGGGDQLGYQIRRQPHMSDPARDTVNPLRVSGDLQEGQYEHAILRTRGMPGIRDAADGSPRPYGIRAVHRFGLGDAVTRPADEGTDPGANPVDTDYRRRPQGPRPGVLDKYVAARSILPSSTEGQGYPRLPYYHQLSPQVTMGDDLYAPFDPRLGGQ